MRGRWDELDPVDCEALERSLTRCLELEPFRRNQIEHMLEDNRVQAATFASMCAQCITLRLRPWEVPPAWAGSEHKPGHSESEVAATNLVRRLQALGLSKWDPDPQAAIEAAEKRLAAEEQAQEQKQKQKQKREACRRAARSAEPEPPPPIATALPGEAE